MAQKSVIVIGAGVAGLVTARELARDGFRVTVLDAADHAGGCVATHEVAGLRLDSGAESFATRGDTVADFLVELGLGDDIVTPNPRGAWLQLQDAAAPLPKNTLLGIPGVPLADDVRRILGWSGALRAQADRVLPFLRVRKEADLGDLVRRRMGRKVLDRLVAPVVSGVHSAHPDLVDVQAVAPGLTTAMTNQGSLSGAVMSLIARRGQSSSPASPAPIAESAARSETAAYSASDSRVADDSAIRADGGRPAAGSAVAGIDGGMYRLVEALVTDCERLGVDLQLGVGVRSIRRVPASQPDAAESVSTGSPAVVATPQRLADETSLADAASLSDPATGTTPAAPRPEWMIVLNDDTVLGSHGVVVAAGFRAALELLRGAADAGQPPSLEARLSGDAPLESDLTRVTRAGAWPGSSVVTLATLVLDAPELDAPPRGTGVLVAEGVTTVGAKALTHATAKWPWLAREAGAGRHMVRLSYGRGGETPPEVTLAQALADASVLLGIPLTERQVRGFALTDWADSLAFATAGHRDRVDELVEAVHGHPGLEVVGAWISGTGLAYVIGASRVKAREFAVRLAGA